MSTIVEIVQYDLYDFTTCAKNSTVVYKHVDKYKSVHDEPVQTLRKRHMWVNYSAL